MQWQWSACRKLCWPRHVHGCVKDLPSQLAMSRGCYVRIGCPSQRYLDCKVDSQQPSKQAMHSTLQSTAANVHQLQTWLYLPVKPGQIFMYVHAAKCCKHMHVALDSNASFDHKHSVGAFRTQTWQQGPHTASKQTCRIHQGLQNWCKYSSHLQNLASAGLSHPLSEHSSQVA